MKKPIYIIAFVFFGILAQFLAHAALEIWYINLLLRDFEKYGFGFSWNRWETIHYVGTVVLFVVGAFLGFWQGKHWHKKIYDKN